VDASIKDAFIIEIQKKIKEMYGNALENKDYPKIINKHHFERLLGLIDGETEKVGGRREEKSRKIEPTLFINAAFEDEIMKEEIFGPILPIISYENLKDVIKILKEKPKSLAFYIFSRNPKLVENIINTVEFGGGCVNDVIMHLANHYLPFGGLGGSGMGNYHGKYSFATFTHEKAVLKSKGFPDICLRYPPYTQKQLKMLRKITH
ncbi:MAG: aldehyde dehydrogenase family protein, partial [Acetivibrio sp.]